MINESTCKDRKNRRVQTLLPPHLINAFHHCWEVSQYWSRIYQIYLLSPIKWDNHVLKSPPAVFSLWWSLKRCRLWYNILYLLDMWSEKFSLVRFRLIQILYRFGPIQYWYQFAFILIWCQFSPNVGAVHHPRMMKKMVLMGINFKIPINSFC